MRRLGHTRDIVYYGDGLKQWTGQMNHSVFLFILSLPANILDA